MSSCFLSLYVDELCYIKRYTYQYRFASLVRNGILFDIVTPIRLRNRMKLKRWYYVRFRLKSEFPYFADELYSCLKSIDSRVAIYYNK